MATLIGALMRDTRANQPAAAAANTGALYCVTDEGNIIEQSDGAAWSAYSPTPSVGALDDLTDVDAPTPSDGDVLTFNNGTGNWEPAAPSGGGGSAPAWTTDSAEMPPGSPNIADDEFGGTDYPAEVALDTGGTRFSGANAWTWVNQGAATAVLSKGYLALTAPAVAGENCRLIVQTLPVGNWRYEAHFTVMSPANNLRFGGIALRKSSNGQFSAAVLYSADRINVFHYTNPTSASSDSGNTQVPSLPQYFAIEYDGTNHKFYISYDGASWYLWQTLSATLFMSGGPDQIGLVVNSNDGTRLALLSCSYFRRTA